jgi:antitoxin component YwqK of YwqJK toxin-antitoxin module
MNINLFKDKSLKLFVAYDSYIIGGVSYKHVSDENNKTYGEYIDYYTNGQISVHCFCVDNFDVGIFKTYNVDGKIQYIKFFSLKNPGHEINEAEYKKELAQYRLGIIKCPALEIFIKDYDENGKIK